MKDKKSQTTLTYRETDIVGFGGGFTITVDASHECGMSFKNVANIVDIDSENPGLQTIVPLGINAIMMIIADIKNGVVKASLT